ncbi:MAG: hypothetical protein QUS14_14105, partial [Pyrinomonadaceae bacterium]|nr:hypothetical protein [Pyrinomonadaceae bacterium]
ITNWLFSYQLKGPDSYLHSLGLYKQTGSPAWLLAAISKADKSSPEVGRLIEAAERVPRSSPAYPTAAFHVARLLIESGKKTEAEKVVDEALSVGDTMPVSTVNQFTEIRQQMAPTLDDFLRYSARRAFIFDFGGSLGTIDEFVAEQKSYFNPEYNKEGREAFEREVEENFRAEREWQGREMFDYRTVNQINQFFPLSLIIDAQRSPVLPDYLRDRFAVAAWTRAILLDDFNTAARIAPEVVKFHPELAEPIKFIQMAPTVAAKKDAALYMLIKNPMMTPLIEDGLGKTDNTADVWDVNDWWCEPYDETYDESTGQIVPRSSLKRPSFITGAHFEASSREREKLKSIGDAPKYLAEQALALARRSPNDKRVPELLFLMHKANGWSKWGCGSNFELQKEIGELMRRRYPSSPWTRQLIADEAENPQ